MRPRTDVTGATACRFGGPAGGGTGGARLGVRRSTIARSRGADDEAVAAAWRRLESRGLASDAALNDEGRRFRLELEARTDALTEPAWRAVGARESATLCEMVEAHHDDFVARIDATAGPRWMPAVRGRPVE